MHILITTPIAVRISRIAVGANNSSLGVLILAQRNVGAGKYL